MRPLQRCALVQPVQPLQKGLGFLPFCLRQRQPGAHAQRVAGIGLGPLRVALESSNGFFLHRIPQRFRLVRVLLEKLAESAPAQLLQGRIGARSQRQGSQAARFPAGKHMLQLLAGRHPQGQALQLLIDAPYVVLHRVMQRAQIGHCACHVRQRVLQIAQSPAHLHQRQIGVFQLVRQMRRHIHQRAQRGLLVLRHGGVAPGALAAQGIEHAREKRALPLHSNAHVVFHHVQAVCHVDQRAAGHGAGQRLLESQQGGICRFGHFGVLSVGLKKLMQLFGLCVFRPSSLFRLRLAGCLPIRAAFAAIP